MHKVSHEDVKEKVPQKFNSGDGYCCGFLHLPTRGSQEKPPLVLMGHGYAALWDFGTAALIAALNDAGIATFNFDYRHFGDSAGEPRQLVDVQLQLEDWRAALAHIAGLADINGERIGIWGSSQGGGHAISIAAEDHNVKALVAQVPHCSSEAAARNIGRKSIARNVLHALRDVLHGKFGLAPHCIPAVAEPGASGVMSFAGWKTEYLKIVSPGAKWENAVPARSLLRGADYNPQSVAAKVTCPALLVYGLQDEGVPVDAVEATANAMNADRWAFDGGHFDVYFGELLREVVQREVRFFSAHL